MKKRLLTLFLAAALCVGLLPAAVFAAGTGPTKSANRNKEDYTVWSQPVTSYLYDNGSGVTRVEYTGGQVVVEDYDSSLNYLSGRSIAPELPIWGGFYAGADYNFLIFGQKNPSESNSVEVIRVVKYDKSWNRLGAASLKGANTTVPFDAGSLRCDEYGGYLYIRTSHEMYKYSDGVNHQANLTMSVRQSDMTITDSYYDIWNDTYGYVSHSFNQFLIVDESGKIVTLDHGDGSPRAVVFMRYYADASTGKFRGSTYGTWCSVGNLQTFSGSIGQNATGASVGGLAETRDAYVFAYNYNPDGRSNDGRYPVLHYMDIASGRSWQVKINLPGCTTPMLAPTGLDGGYMLWNAKNGYTVGETLYYVPYGADGKPGQYQTATAPLSDCQPIAWKDGVLWYVTDNSAPTFYTLDASGVKSYPTGSSAQTAPDSTPAPTPTPEPETTPAPAPSQSSYHGPTFADGEAILQDGTLVSYGIDENGDPVTGRHWIYENGNPSTEGRGKDYIAVGAASPRGSFYLNANGDLLESSQALSPADGPVLRNVTQASFGAALTEDGTFWSFDDDYDEFERVMDGVKQISNVCLSVNDFWFILKEDGTLWSTYWKRNERITKKLMDGVAYASGTLAIKADGSLWSCADLVNRTETWLGWSSGGSIDVGDIQVTAPVKIMDNVVNVRDVGYEKFAITADGKLYKWESYIEEWETHDRDNPVDTGSIPHKSNPEQLAIDNVVDVDYCGNHGVLTVLKKDGTLWWYDNENAYSTYDENYKPTYTFFKVLDNVKLPGSGLSAAPSAPSTPSAPAAPDASFSDVKSGDWFADPVKWAVQNGITNGTSAARFSPNQNCTQGQILTFLYRAEQKISAPSAADMDAAVAWARSKGMIGSSFNANTPCTRATAVNYIWQAAGRQSAGTAGFADVPANASYAQAVAWAVQNGVTEGTSATTFSPDRVCTRGHIVTFLYRAFQ